MRKKIKVGLIVDEFLVEQVQPLVGTVFWLGVTLLDIYRTKIFRLMFCSEEVKSIFQRNILEKMMLICINCRKLGLWPAVG